MSIPSFSLEGKVAIVTGAKSAIGKAIALAYAEAGADVAMCNRRLEVAPSKDPNRTYGSLPDVAEEIRKIGRRSLAMRCDISVKADVDNFVQKVAEEFGTIDILVNNAAIPMRVDFLDLTEEQWDRCFDVDMKGIFLMSQAVCKIMVAQKKKGSIINISAISGVMSNPYVTAYCAAKAAVIHWTKSVAVEMGHAGIRFNVISASHTWSPMIEGQLLQEERLKNIIATHPLGWISEPKDLVGTALFLASDECSGWITGHNMIVDGGRSCNWYGSEYW